MCYYMYGMKGFVHVYVRYLLELDCEGDPAWDTLCNMHQWMLRLLYNSKEEFQGTGKPPSGEQTLSSHPTSTILWLSTLTCTPSPIYTHTPCTHTHGANELNCYASTNLHIANIHVV